MKYWCNLINKKGAIFMHKMNIILFVTLHFFIAAKVYANSNWLYIGENVENESFFIEQNSIQRSGDSVTFWRRVNNAQRDSNGNYSSKVQFTVNCRTQEMIMRYLMFYDDLNNSGKLTDSFSAINPNWRPIAPDSMDSAVLRTVCK
jgi:hypothetical protein